MGQIFNRISRIAKSYINDDDNNISSGRNVIEKEDDDLKKIIEDLNKQKSNSSSGKEYSNQKKKSPDYSGNITLDQAFGILGIKSSASVDEIKSAYKTKVKEYHPDKVAALGSELQELARQKTQQINLAYDLIRKTKGFS